MSDGVSEHIPDQRALDLQRAAGRPLPEEDAERIAHQLLDAADEAGLSIEEYVVQHARGLDVTAPQPGMKSAFWSHGVPHPDLPPGQLLSNQFIAAAWTEEENAADPGSARYLEGTPGGRTLDALHLWNPDVQRILGLNEEQGNGLARQAWSALSEEYAKTTDGEAVAFTQTMAPWSVAYETEMPQLRQGVGPENIRFAYDLPDDVLKGLPPETQQLLNDGATRSHLHFFAPDENNPPSQKYWSAGYLDLDHLRSLDTPEAQRAAVLEVCGRVAALDGRTADAEKYTEESLALRAEQEQQQGQDQAREQPQAQVQPQEQQQQPAKTQEAAAVPAGFHGVNWMPGVAVDARQVVTPTPHAGPVEPVQAPPVPTRTHGAGLGM